MDANGFRFLIERIGKETQQEYVVVIGASAMIPQLRPEHATALTRTHDVDVVLGIDEREKDRIAFLLGEGSPFDEIHGIHAQPVDPETARYAPMHWISRTRAFRYTGVIALCMEPHDLALSKYGAGREKDLEFTRALAREGYAQKDTLLERLALVECRDELRELMRAKVEERGKSNSRY